MLIPVMFYLKGFHSINNIPENKYKTWKEFGQKGKQLMICKLISAISHSIDSIELMTERETTHDL